MSEVQSRPPAVRGRGSHRGGRGGFRGTRGGSKSHRMDDQENVPPSSIEDQGEIGELKKKFGNKVTTLKALFPEWSDEDLVFALQESDGDMDTVAERISAGTISQWGEVKKKQPKVKEVHTVNNESAGSTRGARGRGGFEGRGRGRGIERGRGGRGARSGSQTNGTPRPNERAAKSGTDGWVEPDAAAPEMPGSWDHAAEPQPELPADEDTTAVGEWANETAKPVPAPAAPQESKSNAIPTGKVTGWAGLFAKPAPAPAPKAVPTPRPASPPEESIPEPVEEEKQLDEGITEHVTEEPALDDIEHKAPETPATDPPTILTPSKDALTVTNLEQLPDMSNPPATATAASTIASTQDTHLPTTSAAPPVRPGMSGFAATAFKATSHPARSASFNRRVMEQHEAVVMPANHAVDRAAVQFGSMGLNGTSDDLDVDEDREEPETRTQLPDDSPAAPRASLPPPPPAPPAQAPVESSPTPRQAPGLPPAPQQSQASPPQTTGYAEQFSRYGQSAQKAFDPFGQQPAQQQQQQPQPQPPTQEPFSSQAPTASQQPSSTTPNDFSSFYTPNQQRDAAAAYQNYYGNYGQGHETQQRSGNAFGTSGQDAQGQYATSRPPANYGQQEAQNSGNNTPNPNLANPQTQQTQPTQPTQQMPQGQAGHAGYQYGYPSAYNQQYPQYAGSYMNQMSSHQHRYGQHRPMFDDVRRQNDDYYMSQNSQYGYNQQYGGTPYNKSNMYGQPQHQYSYEHSSSPANASFNQSSMGGREAMYGRTGSAQPSEAQQTAGSNAFGSIADPFGRAQSGFGGQTQPMTQQHSGQQMGGEDGVKGFDAAKTGGPSPSMSQANRPGSANNMPGQQAGGQSGGFPPPQSQHGNQQAFGGYPQYGGLGNVGAHQSNHHQNSGYGGYGGAAGFGSYGGYASGRGWNGNYGAGH